MRSKIVLLLLAVAALGLTGFVLADDMGGTNPDSSTPPATQPAAAPTTQPAAIINRTLCRH